jgi:hypothetical protein
MGKVVYHTLNYFAFDSGRRTLVAEAWVPTRDIGSIQLALRQATVRVTSSQILELTIRGQETSGTSIPPILHELRNAPDPPTFHRTNKFTEGFQAIIDAYGIASYQEINPGIFTVITLLVPCAPLCARLNALQPFPLRCHVRRYRPRLLDGAVSLGLHHDRKEVPPRLRRGDHRHFLLWPLHHPAHGSLCDGSEVAPPNRLFDFPRSTPASSTTTSSRSTCAHSPRGGPSRNPRPIRRRSCKPSRPGPPTLSASTRRGTAPTTPSSSPTRSR